MSGESDPNPWQQHTAQYIPRMIAVGMTTFEFLHAYIDAMPRAPLAVRLSDTAAVKYQLALLVIGALRTAREIAFSLSTLWLQGHFLLASVGIRMLIELDGQLLWAEKKVLAPLALGEVDIAFERMKKLLLGSKSAVPLFAGETGPHPLINVMEFVRSAETVRPGATSDYEFLCDSAHPSYMMQSWMLFAGPGHDNWSNSTFATQVSPMLDRMLGIAETSLSSLETVADRIMADVVGSMRAEIS